MNNFEKIKAMDLEKQMKRLKWYLNEIRDEELKSLDIDLDEYETERYSTDYSNIINLVEEALEERPQEDCRYREDINKMTEEIIIDGVDVSGCEHINCCDNKVRCVILQDDVCSCDTTCQYYKDCYYKQLKRLEQENEELKERLEQAEEDIKSECLSCKNLITLEQENEELKAENEALIKENEDMKKSFVSHLEFMNIYLINKYRKALKGIREIAENSCDIPCADHCCDCENCKDEITNNGETCMQYGLEKITNKINEVLGNE